MDDLEIRVLGSFRVRQDGKVLSGVDSSRLQALLVYLLVHRDTPQSKQQIAFRFWPDSSDAQARTNLRQLLYRFRQSLPELAPFVSVEHVTLQWHTEAPLDLDLALFEEALERAARAHEDSGCASSRRGPGRSNKGVRRGTLT